MEKQFKLSISYCNNPGFMIRLALVLERREFSIQSLSVYSSVNGETEMQLTVTGNPQKFEQVCKNIEKLIDVLAVKEMPSVRVTTRTLSKEQAQVLTTGVSVV